MKNLACTDRECAEFIAILMIVAKGLEQTRDSAQRPAEEAVELVWQAQRNLLCLADRLYPEPGKMEQRVIAFADRLGFDLRQQYFPIRSNATH